MPEKLYLPLATTYQETKLIGRSHFLGDTHAVCYYLFTQAPDMVVDHIACRLAHKLHMDEDHVLNLFHDTLQDFGKHHQPDQEPI